MLPRLLRRRRRPAPAPPEVAEAVSREVSAAVDSCEGSHGLGHPFLFLRQARGAGGFLTLIGLWGFVAQVAVARETADVVVKEVSLPLRGANPSTLAEAVEVPDEIVAEAADVAANDASLLSKEVKTSTTPSAVAAADEAVTDASPVEELRCV